MKARKIEREMYVLACIPIYGDRGRDFCCDPAGSQESAPELGLGCELAIKNPPRTESLNNGRRIVPKIREVLSLASQLHPLKAHARPSASRNCVAGGARQIIDSKRLHLVHTVHRFSMRARSASAPLTDRQAEVLSFIQARLRAVGVSPTLEEIRVHFGFNSVNAAREHLRLSNRKDM